MIKINIILAEYLFTKFGDFHDTQYISRNTRVLYSLTTIRYRLYHIVYTV